MSVPRVTVCPSQNLMTNVVVVVVVVDQILT